MDNAVVKDIDVFVSYSNKDKAVADGMVATLEQNQLRCWYAPRDIAPGQNWASSIMAAIERAKFFVLVFSDNSNQSGQVLNEVTNAFNSGCVIIPFKIDQVEMHKDLSYYLASVHWLDAVQPPMTDRYEELVEQILHTMGRDVPEGLEKKLKGRREKKAKKDAKKKNPGKKKTGLIVAVIVVLLIALGAAAFLVLGGAAGDGETAEEEVLDEETAETAAAEETQEEEAEEAADETAASDEEEETEEAETAADEAEEEESGEEETAEEEVPDEESEELDASLVSEDGYFLSAEAIPESVFDQMSAEIEDTFTAYVASDWDSGLVTLKGFDCIGFYFLAEKDSASPHNRIYFVYQVNAEYFTEDASGLTDTMVTYYYYGGYDNLRVPEDSSFSVECDGLFTVGETFEDHGLTYKGWQDLNEMYKELVTTRVDDYSCENSVVDKDFGYELTELASYTGIPDDAVEYEGHYYKLYDVGGAIGWEDAKERCENLGGHLVTVTSSAEQEFLETNILQSDGNVWTAAYYNTKGIWQWDTGELMVYTEWTQPDKTTSSTCRYMGIRGYSWHYYDETGYYKNSSSDYGQVTGYVCEWDAEDEAEEDLSHGIDGAVIPDDAKENDGHYYRIYKASSDLTWDEAQALCETLGGHLATVTSAGEQEYLTTNVYVNGGSYFLGAYYDTAGDWVWVTGETMSYMQWSLPSQTTSSTYRYMGIMSYSWHYYNETGYYKNSSSDHDQVYGYLCEWDSDWDPDGDSAEDEETDDAGMAAAIPDDAIEYDGHSYRIYSTSTTMSWDDAEEMCENLGGHLLTITSEEEQDFLEINVFKNGVSYLIGGYYDTSGSWVWVTGETMSYVNWEIPSQTTSSTYRYMGIMSYSWHYYNETGYYKNSSSDNDQTSGFICEWDTTADAAAASDEAAGADEETEETADSVGASDETAEEAETSDTDGEEEETETASTYAE